MEHNITIYVAKATESLLTAESEFVNGRYNSCANRCYYACLQAAIGSLITYFRRYTACPLLGVCADEDDDGTAVDGNSITLQASSAGKAPATANGQPISTPAPKSEAALDHPTEAHITALHTLAVVECHEDPEVFAQRVRTIMGLKPSASVVPKLLTRTMSMSQYMEVIAYYQRLLAQFSRKTEVPDGAIPGTGDLGAAEGVPTPQPVGEPNATEEGLLTARATLRTEAAGWGIAANEIEHILEHHPPAAARNLLWQARHTQKNATLIASAAD